MVATRSGDITAGEIPEAIQWHEGLLLTPQHFQQLSLRQEALLQYVWAGVAPFGWGVNVYEPDEDSLRDGKLTVSRVEAVMPDSLVVSYDAGRDKEELSVKLKAEEMSDGPVTVYLAVPRRQSSALSRDELRRYESVEGEPVSDEEAPGDGGVSIRRLRPRLSLRIKDAPPEKYVSFPLARVAHRKDAFVLEPDFIPPTLRVTRTSRLGRLCALTARHLRENAGWLADQLKKSAGDEHGDPGHADGNNQRGLATESQMRGLAIESRLRRLETEKKLRSLAIPLPALEDVLLTGACHPYQVYQALLSVVGHVSLLGLRPLPPPLRPYDHNDLYATFTQALTLIESKLSEGVSPEFTTHTFRREGDYYSLMFRDEWADRRLLLGMQARHGTTLQEVARWAEGCLIGSAGRMQWLQNTRSLGAPRHPAGPDEFFVPPEDVALFYLKADSEHIRPKEDLQIYNRSDRGGRPAEIVLYVSNKSNSELGAPRVNARPGAQADRDARAGL
ncbi:MAG TPA: type VI secretion system baseplate subunit TssK [Pyrinomonadaceae bacterium]|jgi:type VI secretion system protein ImpJ